MKASILDLRKHMKRIKASLERNETIELTNHGRKIAVILPVNKKQKRKLSVTEHPFFGSMQEDTRSVEEVVNQLRQSRYDSI